MEDIRRRKELFQKVKESSHECCKHKAPNSCHHTDIMEDIHNHRVQLAKLDPVLAKEEKLMNSQKSIISLQLF